MTTFNTGNPLGSTDVYDRYDNSENLDNFSNGPLDAYADRLGVMRQSLQGIRNASQYVNLGPYAAGLVFTSLNQVFSYDAGSGAEFYAPGPSIVLPYTTTGAGAAEIANFRSVGDAVLRQDLANGVDPLQGIGKVARSGQVVDSIAALRLLSKLAISKRAFVLGYYALGDGGGGAYYLDSADTTSADDGGSVIVAADNGRWKLSRQGSICVKQFGAKGNSDPDLGTGQDDTLHIQAALNYAATIGVDTWMTAGGFYVTDRLVLNVRQTLRGVNRAETYLCVREDFNLTATGVVRLVPEAQLFDIGFRFKRVDQGVRANLIAYPYAIDMNSSPRCIIDRIRIERASRGVDCRGNCGGSYIGFIEIGAFVTGIEIDGPLDFFHGGHWHFWLFGIIGFPGLESIYYDGIATALALGLADGLNVDSICTFAQKITIASNAGTELPMQISKLQLDGDAAKLLVAGGTLLVGISYSTKTSAPTVPTIDVSAGTVILGNHRISSTLSSNELHTSGTGKLIVNGGDFHFVNVNHPVAKADGGFLSLSNIYMNPASGAPYTQPHVLQVSGILQVKDCSWITSDGGANAAVSFTTDAYSNLCQGNDFGGWDYVVPDAKDIGQYGPNLIGQQADFAGSLAVGVVKTARLLVTANGSGNFLGLHGIPQLHQKLLAVSAVYRGGGSEARPATVVYVDGGNISISGAAAGARIRVGLTYTETPDTW